MQSDKTSPGSGLTACPTPLDLTPHLPPKPRHAKRLTSATARWRTTWARWAIGLVSLILLTVGCQSTPLEATPPAEEQAGTGLPAAVSATGVVVPAHWTRLSFTTGGIVAEVLVSEGEQVHSGQALLRLAGGNPQNPSPELQAAIQARELDVEAARQALDDLDKQAEARLLQAQQILNSTASQVRDLQYQLAALDLPEEQADLAPLDAYDLAFEAYQQAEEVFRPFKDEPTSNADRRERKEDLDQAQADYDIAIRRLQLSLALEVALANRDQARQDYDTYQAGAPIEERESTQKRLESAQSALQATRVALASLTLNAPFAGTVSEVYLRPGEWATPGMPALTVADLDSLRIETTDLNEIDMTRIAVGDQVSLSFDALPELTLAGEVLFIAPQASPGSGVNYKTIITLQSVPTELRWGMSAFVDILPGR